MVSHPNMNGKKSVLGQVFFRPKYPKIFSVLGNYTENIRAISWNIFRARKKFLSPGEQERVDKVTDGMVLCLKRKRLEKSIKFLELGNEIACVEGNVILKLAIYGRTSSKVI